MTRDSEISKAIAKACPSTASPFDIGVSVGRFLYNIESLVVSHLEHSVDCQLPIPEALHWAPDFLHAINSYMFHLRETYNLPDPLEDMPLHIYDRKARYKQRKCKEKCTRFVETHCKQCVRGVLQGVFTDWDPVKTQEFNKGIDKALTRTQWRMYPLGNVVLEARDGD